MNLFLLLFPVLLFLPGKAYKIELGKQEGRTNNWVILTDNVMGGLSAAEMEYRNTSLMIKGTVSLKNRGGFVSIKSAWDKLDLSSFTAVRITFRSTKQKFAFTLENSRAWYEPAYKHEFSAREINTWETATLKLDNFMEEEIGKPTGNKVNKSILGSILRLGISTNEKREGPFQLEIESIEFVASDGTTNNHS